MAEPITIELKVISCRHLNSFNLFQKLSTYAVVSIVGREDSKKNTKDHGIKLQRTPVDRDGDVNPEWNHEIIFDLREVSLSDFSTLFLKFDIRCKGIIFGKKTIGEVCVPLEDLMDEYNGVVRFVSYQVRTTGGSPNGVLNFSYKVGGYGRLKRNKTGFSSEKVSYPSVEVDFSSGENSNSPHTEKGFVSHQKCHYPTSEVLEEMRLPTLSPMAPWAYHRSPPPGGRDGYFYNTVGH